MTIFLTGGTGFVGTHLLRHLGPQAQHVRALRRPGSEPCLALEHAPQWLERPMDQLEVADLAGVEVLVHLASAGVSPKQASWQELLYWNVQVMLDLMEKAHAAGVRRFVLAGSFAEYGRAADRYEAIPPDAPLLPTAPYAASKAAGFAAAYGFAVERQVQLSYLRIFSAYGDGQFEGNFWPALRAAALRGEDFPMTPGEQVRDFVAVEQVARAFAACIERPRGAPGQPHVANVGSGKPLSMLEFARREWQQWGARGSILAGARPYRPSEPMRFVPQVDGDLA